VVEGVCPYASRSLAVDGTALLKAMDKIGAVRAGNSEFAVSKLDIGLVMKLRGRSGTGSIVISRAARSTSRSTT
jgi:hypothetical protein